MPPGAAGTTNPITQAKEKTDVHSPKFKIDSIEKAYKQKKNPQKRRNIKSISANNGIQG